ncbi:MAG: hypothetical protein GX053_01975 [Tissierella sp.]|nr:hypothetical protein [Tissierella sp.]
MIKENDIDIHDLVKIKQAHDEDTEEFVGALGIISNIYDGNEYPYEILFVGKKLNERSKELGDLLWKSYQLEAV